MPIQNVLNRLERLRRNGEITAWVSLEEKPGLYQKLPESLSPTLVSALQQRNIDRLYSHQADSFQAVQEGRNVVLVTPTASGKTLCYNLPVLDQLLKDPGARALYLFPTKALAQDQMAELLDLTALLDQKIGVNTYDGDTPADVRRRVRAGGRIILTNPDMLHTALLPHHPRWIQLFQSLRYVVIDEMHTYRGVFGSHVANVFRRLKRIARFYGSKIQFICTSATIANPEDLASGLLEEEVTVLERSGAPQAAKEILFYNPPLVNPQLGLRRSALSAARQFAEKFLRDQVQTIVFASSRVNVEVLLSYLKRSFERNPTARNRVRGYRGGYLPRRRREIERQLRQREVLGVVSTNALELGIDIGSLEACVLAGYPGSVASTWQQIGRCGRKQGRSAAVLVARNLPLDQFIVSHPEYFFDRSPEHGLIHPDNLQILVSHVKCAAFELPFEKGEWFGGEDLSEILNYLAEKGTLCRSGNSWHWSEEAYPANSVSLRSVAEENFVVFNADDHNRAIAEVDFDSAPELIHEDAIYICEGQQYHVERLDFEGRKAYVREVQVDYYTEAISYSGLKVLQVDDQSQSFGHRIEHGEVHLSQKFPGFKKIRFYTGENLGFGKIHLPNHEMHTTAYWLMVPEEELKPTGLSRTDLARGFLGISYALQHVATLLLMCDIRDLGRSVGDRSARWFAQLGGDGPGFYSAAGDLDPSVLDRLPSFEPTVFLFDNLAGGVGFSVKLFDSHHRLVRQTQELIQACGCRQGCPSCVGPVPNSSVNTRELSLSILERLLEPALVH